MSIGMTTTYLYIGLDAACIMGKGRDWPNVGDGGHIELVAALEERAKVLEALYDAEFEQLHLLVVFDYDVTEPLGVWLLDNWDASDDAFRDEARRRVKEMSA